MGPVEVLQQGASILDSALKPHGFVFVFKGSGTGSGGAFAWGEYVRGSRRLEVHFRFELGCVAYRDGNHSIDHVTYMKALGSSANSAFGSTSDPLDAFRQVARDIVEFATDFTSGSASILRSAAQQAADCAADSRRRAMARAVGDEQRRTEARQSFYEGDYAKARELLEGLVYPDIISEADRRILQLARQRT